jgi:hypothetical protein
LFCGRRPVVADDLIRRYGKRPFIGRGKGAKPAFPAMIADELPASKLGKLDPAEVRAYYERRHPDLTLESRSLYLSDPLVSAALEAAKPVNLDAAPTLVDSVQAAKRRRDPAPGLSLRWTRPVSVRWGRSFRRA